MKPLRSSPEDMSRQSVRPLRKQSRTTVLQAFPIPVSLISLNPWYMETQSLPMPTGFLLRSLRKPFFAWCAGSTGELIWYTDSARYSDNMCLIICHPERQRRILSIGLKDSSLRSEWHQKLNDAKNWMTQKTEWLKKLNDTMRELHMKKLTQK